MIRPNKAVSSLEKYVPASPEEGLFYTKEDYLKLDSNEATIRPSPLVFHRIQEFLFSGHINWYPDIEARELKTKLTRYTGRCFDEIQVFNGSDSALDCICRTYVDETDVVLAASPTYDKFRVFAESLGTKIEFIHSQDPFKSDIQNLIGRVTEKTKLIYLCNPNNPTGSEYGKHDIATLLEKLERGILIVDEAYYEYSGKTMADLIKKFDNLIITRSFSKAFGLASLRCGYILSDAENVSHINKIRDEKSVNAVALIAAAASLDDLDYMRKYVKEVNHAKKWLVKNLRLLGYQVISTPANFILLKVKEPRVFIRELSEDKILIRDRSQMSQLENHVRITVGHMEQCKKLIKTVREKHKASHDVIQN